MIHARNGCGVLADWALCTYREVQGVCVQIQTLVPEIQRTESFESSVWKDVTILFHSEEERTLQLEVAEGAVDRYAEWATARIPTVEKKAIPDMTDFLIVLMGWENGIFAILKQSIRHCNSNRRECLEGVRIPDIIPLCPNLSAVAPSMPIFLPFPQ